MGTDPTFSIRMDNALGPERFVTVVTRRIEPFEARTYTFAIAQDGRDVLTVKGATVGIMAPGFDAVKEMVNRANRPQVATVWVVMERTGQDGYGDDIVGVYSTKERAQAVADEGPIITDGRWTRDVQAVVLDG